MRQGHTSTMLIKHCLNTIEYLQNSLPPEPQLSDFYHPSEPQRSGELLFVAVGKALQHMPCISTLNE